MPVAALRIVILAIVISTQAAVSGSITTGNRANLNFHGTTKVVSNTKQQSGDSPNSTAQQGANRKAAIDAEMRSRLLRHGFTDQQIDKIFKLALAEALQRSSSAQAEMAGSSSGMSGASSDVRIDPGEYRASLEDFGAIKIVTNPEGAPSQNRRQIVGGSDRLQRIYAFWHEDGLDKEGGL